MLTERVETSKPILSICIPTYNRSHLLDNSLKNISSQINDELAGLIEVLVSDNASTDNTGDVVSGYKNVKYYRNEENLGFDGNFINCYLKAISKYIWIFGDDDILLPGYLNDIILLLKNSNYGVIHIESQSFSNEREIIYDNSIINIEKGISGINFIDKVNYFLTLITSNIFNKEIIKDKIQISVGSKTNLIQVEWYIVAAFATENNSIIHNRIVACKADNTGGYKLVTTFSKNYNSILKKLVKKGYDKRIVRLTNEKLITSFFPHHLKRVLYLENSFVSESGFLILLKEYWRYRYFWSFLLPMYLKYFLKKISKRERNNL